MLQCQKSKKKSKQGLIYIYEEDIYKGIWNFGTAVFDRASALVISSPN